MYICDEAPFIVHPFVIEEEQKLVIEKEINYLEKLEIIRNGLTGYSSPVLLAKRKCRNVYRFSTDLWILND